MRKVALIALIMVLATARCARTDAALNTLVGTPASDPGMTASEMLPGNGTRAGYMLGHGNVIPGSEWVSIGAKHGTRNRDYSIDNASGTLFFTEPVSQMDCVQVDYRYSTQAGAQRSAAAPGMVALRFGNGLQTNMLYSYQAANAAQGLGAQDILTYGMNTLSKFGGSGANSLSSMFYVTSPETANRMNLNTTGAPVKAAAKVKKDHLMVQDADLHAGKFRLKLGYQDVGQDFAGFATLRDSKAAADDVLNQLEKEKGIRRMSISGELPSGVAGQGLNFAMNQIGDKDDNILSRSLGYKSGGFAFSYSARDIGKQFSRFKDLKEADRGQLAAEQGMSRQSFGMQFRTALSADKKPIWSGLSFTDLSDGSANLSIRQADVELGNVKIQADVRTSDPTFNRLSALSDDERTRMALMARRQFDPTAPATQVTADDKARIVNEQGLDRSTCLVQLDTHSVDTWMSMSSIDSVKGGVNRRAFGVKTGRFSAYFGNQSVDPTFEKLGILQPIEKAHFGNEFGMSRTELGGKLNIFRSDVTLDTANVVDNIGAGFFREGFTLKNPKLSVVANFQDIDPRFSRIMDLSDPDKAALALERGFKRSDYAIKFQATRSLSIDSYVYDSTNITAGQTRGQNRHKISYTPPRGPKVNMLRDDYSYVAENGNIASYSHQEVKFDHNLNILGGLAVKSRSDVYTNMEEHKAPLTTTISENHVESNQKVKTSFTADVVNIDYGNGKYDNTQAVGIKTAAVRNLSVIGGFATTARDSNKSETNGRFGFEWAARKDLKMTFSVANRDGGLQGSQQASSFSLNGLLAKRFLLLRDISIASATNQTALRGRQTVCDDAFKVNAGLIGGKLLFDNTDKLNTQNGLYYTSRIFQYESDKDPKKPWHLTLFRQNLTTPLGARANKRNYCFDYIFAHGTSLTFSSYLGKDGQNGVVIPVQGTVVKLNRPIDKATTLIADYTTDANAETDRHARVIGCGISRAVTNATSYELYYGWCNLDEGALTEHKNIFRAKYDTKLSADNYITFSIQRKSGVDKTTINPWEGDTVGRVDLKFMFD
jgi:hypothetical protein